MFNKNILLVTLGVALLLPASVSAGELLSLDKGAAKTINVKRNIDTVFVADTQIADY
ncbi:pilus assembly protein N-terminal domain-containing protein, partial [Vibrio sp. Vb0599]